MRTAASMITPANPSEPSKVRTPSASSSEALRTISRVSGGERCGVFSFTFAGKLCARPQSAVPEIVDGQVAVPPLEVE